MSPGHELYLRREAGHTTSTNTAPAHPSNRCDRFQSAVLGLGTDVRKPPLQPSLAPGSHTTASAAGVGVNGNRAIFVFCFGQLKASSLVKHAVSGLRVPVTRFPRFDSTRTSLMKSTRTRHVRASPSFSCCPLVSFRPVGSAPLEVVPRSSTYVRSTTPIAKGWLRSPIRECLPH